MRPALRSALPLLLVPLLSRAAAAQLAEADSAFARGDRRAARAGYETVLAQDSSNVRALYRLAVLDSWDHQFGQSLTRFERLRRLAPADGDVMVSHATALSWSGNNRAAELLFDSVLARSPERTDALAGRARAVAWGGDLVRAEELWREALRVHPDAPEVLLGLAQTLWWQGKPALAESYAARALQLAPEDPAARDLLSAVRAALRAEAQTGANYSRDSDRNAALAYDASFTASLMPGLRTTLVAGWRRATLPFAAGLSYGAGGYAIKPLSRSVVLRAGLGARRLEPDSGADRTQLTAQLGLGLRPSRFTSLSAAYSRSPFDETALLIRQGFHVDGLDIAFDVAPRALWSVSASGGAAWLSDGNRRLTGILSVTAWRWRGFEVGPWGRLFGYRQPNPGRGYFAPDRFGVIEARAAYTWRQERWGVRADGGLGAQQVGKGAAAQLEWHAGALLTRGWGANSELALVGSLTNSAASRTVTAVRPSFRFWTVALRLRQGL